METPPTEYEKLPIGVVPYALCGVMIASLEDEVAGCALATPVDRPAMTKVARETINRRVDFGMGHHFLRLIADHDQPTVRRRLRSSYNKTITIMIVL
jgi:hypothetical protein